MNSVTSRRRARLASAALSAVAAVLAIGGSHASAADLSWDGDGQLPVNGGFGVWDTTTPRWYNGSAYVAWPNTTGDNAYFTNSGIVQLGASLNANSVTLSGGGNYTFLNPGTSIATLTLGGGTIDTGSGYAEFVNGFIQSGGLTKNGSGTMAVYRSLGAGNVTVNAGTLGSLSPAADILSDTTMLTVAAGATYNMALAGAGGADGFGGFKGAGNIVLGTFTNLGVNVGSSLTSGTLTTGTDVWSGTISGGGRFQKVGTGTIQFTGTNTFTGPISIQNGVLEVSGGNAIADTAAVFMSNVAGATLKLSGNETIGSIGGGGTTGGNVDIGANTLTIGGDNTFNGFGGNFIGSGLIVKTGTGVAAVQNTTPLSSYTGGYRIDSGILSLRNDDRIGATSGIPATQITLNGGIFANSVGGGYAMNASRNIGVTAASGINVYGTSASSISIQGTVTGSAALNKGGLGTLNLAADNRTTLSSDWTVADGALMTNVNSNAAVAPLGTGNVNLNGGYLIAVPTAGSGDPIVDVATGAGKAVNYGPGSVLRVDKNTNNSLTLNLGGLNRAAGGALLIQAASTSALLGSGAGAEKINVAGGVTTVNGIIPGVYLTTSAGATAGDLADYGANGIVRATYSSTDLNAAGATDVVNQTTGVTLGSSKNVYALKIGDGAGATAVDLGGNTLSLGAGSDPAMLLINTQSTLSNGVVDFGARQGLVYAQGAAGAVTATLTGTGGLQKTGTGPLVLNTAATYTGNTTIGFGTITLGVDNALPTGTNVRLHNTAQLNLAGRSQTLASLNSDALGSSIGFGINGQLTVGAGDMVYMGGATNDASSTTSTLTKDGAGTLRLGFVLATNTISNATMSYNKLVVKNGGVVQTSGTAAVGQNLPATSPTAGVPIADTFTLDNGTLRISSVLSGGLGSGSASTYTLAGSDTTLRGFTIGAGGGTIEVTEAKEIVIFQRGNAEVAASAAPLLNGSGTFYKSGPGFLRLGVGNDNFTGKIVVRGGNLQFQTDQASAVVGAIGNAFGPAPATLVADQLTLDGGMIQTNGTGVLAATRGITVGAGGGTLNGALTFNGPFAGTGPLTKITTSTAIINSTSPTYSGTFTHIGGLLALNNSDPVGVGTFNLTPNFPTSIGKTAGASDSVLSNQINLNPGSAIEVRADGGIGNLVLNGAIHGSNNLYKTGGAGVVGQGTLVLGSNTSDFTGNVVVATGTVVAKGTAALGSATGSTMVSPGAALGFDSVGNYTNAEPIHIAGTGLSSGGALFNTAGTNVVPGTVTAYQDALVNVVGGSLRVGNVRGASVVSKGGVGDFGAASIRTSGLSINTGAVRITATGTANTTTSTSVVSNLTIAGGPSAPTATLDLGNNSLVIDYTGSTVLTDVRQYLQAGFAPSSTGGITSSSATTTPNRRIGYAEASTVLGVGGGVFAGVSVDGSAILLKYTYGGDTNLDGKVDIADLGALASSWQQSGVWSNGDSDYTGFVDVADLGILAGNWQQGVINPPPLGPSLAAALESLGLPSVSVPEPTSLALLALGAGSLLRRRRA